MDCRTCRYKRLQEESALALAERTIRRLWITIMVMIVMMTGMAVGFFLYEAQFEDVETVEETQIEAAQVGEHNFVSGGDINYGTEGQSQEDR